MVTMTSEANPSGANDAGRVLNDLSARVDAEPGKWRDHIFQAISRWSLPCEEIDDEPHVYFIAGEAFNWRRLAERLAWHITFLLNDDEESAMSEWLEDAHMFGGLEEAQFRRVLGHEKWRAFLNYFYGVTLERCLLLNIGARITKDRFAGGKRVNDDMLDEAFVSLYEASEFELWMAFASESGLEARSSATRTLAIDDEFTYWLFKRRIGSPFYRANVAHEVKGGLEAFANITAADKRRKFMLALGDCRELLEFKMAKRVVNRGGNARGALLRHA